MLLYDNNQYGVGVGGLKSFLKEVVSIDGWDFSKDKYESMRQIGLESMSSDLKPAQPSPARYERR